VCLVRGALSLASREFETFLLEAVDWGLASLGESPKQATYFHLEKSFGVRREEIPCKVAAFAGAVEEIFGQGAEFLEGLILKRLCENVGTPFDWDLTNYSEFGRCVARARRVFHQKQLRKRVDKARGGSDTLVNARVLDPLGGDGKRCGGR
jgi:hypothetical protein